MNMSVVPLPEQFKRHSYLVLGGGKVYHPGTPANNDIPYSWSEGPLPYLNFSDANDTCPGESSPWPGKYPGCGGCAEDRPADDEAFYDFRVANHTVHALRAAKADTAGRPFFVAAGFRRPHTPWHVAQHFVDLYPSDATHIAPASYPAWAAGQPPCAFMCGSDGVACDFDITRPRNVSWSSLCRRTYYAAVTATDHYIGMVLDELDALNLTDSTAVAMMGDHGWHLGEGDQWAKYTTTEIGTRIPFIVRAPWLVQREHSGAGTNHASSGMPVRATTMAEAVDLFPTLTELAGIPSPTGLEGRSLVPALREPATALVRPTAGSQFAHCCPNTTKHWPLNASSMCEGCSYRPSAEISYMGYAVRDAQWRFVEWYGWDGAVLRPNCSELMAMELYPHAGDTGLGEQAFDSSRRCPRSRYKRRASGHRPAASASWRG